MYQSDDDGRQAYSPATPARSSRSSEGPLIKEAGSPLESHGPHLPHTAFEMDVDTFVGEFNERVIGAESH